MDWQNTDVEMGDANPVQPAMELACGSLCLCCIYGFKNPKLSVALITAVVGAFCLYIYVETKDESPTFTSFTDKHATSYFAHSTFSYLNKNIWMFGADINPKNIYYINTTDKDQDTFNLQQAIDMTANHSFSNFIQSVSHHTTNSIWSADLYQQFLVSFTPKYTAENIILYKIPLHGHANNQLFNAQCMTLDEAEDMLYIVGGYNNNTYYSDPFNVFGEVLVFNLHTKQWTDYYSTDNIGHLKAADGFDIFAFGCSYNNDKLFAFGGAYYGSAVNEIHFVDLKNNGKWELVEDVTLNLGLSQLTAVTFDAGVYIYGGDIYGDVDRNDCCYLSQHIFDPSTMRITSYVSYESLTLPLYSNWYVVSNYDASIVYIMYSDDGLVTYYFRGKVKANKKTYLIIAVSCGVIVCGCFFYYLNSRNTEKSEQERLVNK